VRVGQTGARSGQLVAGRRVLWAAVAFSGGGLLGVVLVLPWARWWGSRQVAGCASCRRRHRLLSGLLVVLAVVSVAGFALRVSQRARELPACVPDTSIAQARSVLDPRAPRPGSPWARVRSVMTAPASGLALGFAEWRGRGLCSVGEPPMTLAFVPQAKDAAGSTVGEVFLASARPVVAPWRAKALAEHESRHADQWAACELLGGIALLPAAYLVDETLYPGSENHFEQAAGLADGRYPPPPEPPVGPRPWAVALWLGCLLLVGWRRVRWAVRTVVRRVVRTAARQPAVPQPAMPQPAAPADGRCALHTPGWS
jgi:hypothetical protein